MFGLKQRRTEAERQSFDWWVEQYMATWKTGGNTYTQPFQTTIPGEKAAAIAHTFSDYLNGGYAGNGVIFGLASVRMRVFSEARFMFQRLRDSRPGDLFGTADLSLLERPWPGGTTGDLLSAMLLHADFAGNAFVVRSGNQLVLLRPDWVQIMLGERTYTTDIQEASLGTYATVGYTYYPGGITPNSRPVYFNVDEVCHFMPQPDPRAPYNVGMSWLTPVIREIQADGAATSHKLKFFENAATPNLAVALPKEVTPAQFLDFVDAMDEKHSGAQNAYKTLYTGGGADVTVIGTDMRQLDFKVTQGAGETRLAQAAGVPPVVAGLSEGLQGSSLNAGNFGQARRQFADTTLSNLWRNVAGSLERIIRPPADARLWYDTRDIPFLREDEKDEAEIQATQAQTIKAVIEAGYDPDAVLLAVTNLDWTMLQGKHSGMYSVQLQAPGELDEKPMTVRELAEALQKIYLAVGVVISPEEARAILNRDGANLPTALPQLGAPARDKEIHVHNNVDARTQIERGAFEFKTGNIDNSTGLSREDLEEGFRQLELPIPQVTVEAPVVNMPDFPEIPATVVNVTAPAQKPVRRDAVRGEDGRIAYTIDRVIDE